MLSTSAAPARSVRDGTSFWQYRALILNFARRDLHARFKGTILGFAWSVALPLASLAIYSIVFGIILGGDAPLMGNGEDAPFPIWLFAGLVPWSMYAVTLGTAIASLVGNGPLMKKIYFPAYASVYGSVLATLYQSVVELGILVVSLLIFVNIGPTWLGLLGWFLVFGVFVSSISLAFSVLNVYWRDTAHLISILIQLQFYMTPIIYPVTLVPTDWHRIPLRAIMTYQPMAVFVEVFRDLCYGLTLGRGRAWATMLLWTAMAAGASLLIYRRRGLDLSEEL